MLKYAYSLFAFSFAFSCSSLGTFESQDCEVDEYVSDCEDLFIVWNNDIVEVLTKYNECTYDSDCVRVYTELHCPNGPKLGTCQNAINKINETHYDQEYLNLSKKYCDCPGGDCITSASCTELKDKCIDGRCG